MTTMNRLLLVIAMVCVAMTHSSPIKRSFKVYHGDRLTSWADNKFKFVVALFGQSLCSGSIYNTQTIISAGHCFKGETTPTEVLFGAVNVYDPTVKRIDIKSVFLRGDYSKNYHKTQVNGRDFSVVQLVQSIPLTKYDVTIGSFKLTTRPKRGTVLTIVGYGLDSYRNLKAGQFNSGQMKVIDCPVDSFVGKPICMSPQDEFLKQQNEGGDSGGPAVMQSKGKWAVVGVSSGYASYTDNTVVAVYASIAANRKHLENIATN